VVLRNGLFPFSEEVLRRRKQTGFLVGLPWCLEAAEAWKSASKLSSSCFSIHEHGRDVFCEVAAFDEKWSARKSTLSGNPEDVQRWGYRHPAEEYLVRLCFSIDYESVHSVVMVETSPHDGSRLEYRCTVRGRSSVGEQVATSCHFSPCRRVAATLCKSAASRVAAPL